MSLQIENTNLFRNIVRFSKNLSSEIDIFCEEEYILFQINDLFQKILVDINIKKKYFSEIKKFQNVTINSINLNKILLFSNRFSKINLFFNEKNINIDILNENLIKKFKFSLLNKNTKRKHINLCYDHVFEINTKDFHDIIKKCNDISKNITISIKKNKISFISLDDFCSINIEKNIDFDKELEIQMKFDCRSLLSLTRIYKFCDNLTINFDKQLPLKVTSELKEIKFEGFLVQENI